MTYYIRFGHDPDEVSIDPGWRLYSIELVGRQGQNIPLPQRPYRSQSS